MHVQIERKGGKNMQEGENWNQITSLGVEGACLDQLYWMTCMPAKQQVQIEREVGKQMERTKIKSRPWGGWGVILGDTKKNKKKNIKNIKNAPEQVKS